MRLTHIPVLLSDAGLRTVTISRRNQSVHLCIPCNSNLCREAAAPAAGRAARAASAAAIVPGTLLSLALFAIRPLSDSSEAGPGRDISKGAPNRHDAVALRPLPRQEALRDASKLPAPAVVRRQLRIAGRGQRRMSRAAPAARGVAALAAAWLAVRGRRGAPRQRRWRGVVKLRGEGQRKSGQASVRNGQWGVDVAGWLRTSGF